MAPSHSTALQDHTLPASVGRSDAGDSGAGAGEAGQAAGGGDDDDRWQGAAPARASSRHTHPRALSNLEMEIIAIFTQPLNSSILSNIIFC